MSFCALNEVALKRAKAVDDYVRLMLQLEEHFGTARMAMAKARCDFFRFMVKVNGNERLEFIKYHNITSSS